MRPTKLSLATALALALLLGGRATAQEKPAEGGKAPEVEKKKDAKPAGPEFDEGARKIWEAWQRLEYNLGKEGVKRCTHRIKAVVSAMGQTMEGGATFKWDGKKGSLVWDNTQLGAALGQQGWSVRSLSAHFKPGAATENLAGCKITLKAGDTEDRLEVAGRPKDGAPVKAFVFGKDGVLRKWIMEVPDQMTGQTQQLELVMNWQKLDNGKYVNTGWSFSAKTGMGTYAEETKCTVEKCGGWYVLTKVDSTGSVGGQPMVTKKLTFTDWKFNDDVDKAKAEEPAQKEKPAAAPDKPTGG